MNLREREREREREGERFKGEYSKRWCNNSERNENT
jgi:hypothetical protein